MTDATVAGELAEQDLEQVNAGKNPAAAGAWAVGTGIQGSAKNPYLKGQGTKNQGGVKPIKNPPSAFSSKTR
jgi:hypothetical protein